MRKIALVTLVLITLVAACLSAEARVTVERIEYHGWTDSYRLSTGLYSLIVVPEIGGRIMEYSYDGRNAIWQNVDEFGRTYPIAKDWHNYGGYKTWIAPQDLWSWPPDPMLDFGKANIEVFQNPKGLPVLKITGAPSFETGVVFSKEITMSDDGEIYLKQIMQNIGTKPVTYSIWDVTQVKAPCFIAFPVKKKSRFSDGINYLMAESRNSKQFTVKNGLCITSYQGEVGKIAADSDGPWMIMFKDDLAYVKLFDPMVKKAEYPEDGCSVEVFTEEDKVGYLGMELLGPMVALHPGANTELVERWRLFKLGQPVKDERGVLHAVTGMQGKDWIP